MTTLRKKMNMSGRRALVTGATGGLGRVMVMTLAEMGADLILVDRPGTDYATLTEDILALHQINITTIDCDLEQPVQRANMIEQILQSGSSLSVLINNAAFVGTSSLQGWVTPFEEQSVATWCRALEVNLTASFDLVKGLTPALRASGHASIINIASIYGSVGPDYSLYEGTAMGSPAAYAASKGGLIQLTRWLATTLATDNIRVNTISPGGVFRNQPASFVQRYNARTPLGRMATEDDFSGTVAYLASDLSTYVTGQNLMVDGGWGVW